VYCKRTKAPFVNTILILLLIAGLEGCSERRPETVERLGVMPIENLTSDVQLNWRSRAGAAVVGYDLAGAKNIFASPVDSVSAAQSMHASRLLEGYFFERNGRIVIRANVENLAKTKVVESIELEGAEPAGFLPLVNELAKRLRPDARMFGTSNENAFRFYGEAMAAKQPRDVEQALEGATQADPGFAAAYVDEVTVLAETGDRERARQIARAGEAARLDGMDRDNLEFAAATANGDGAEQMKALERLAVASPADANVFTKLAGMRYARREFQGAAEEYRAAARLDPDDPQIWNELGYALAWAKDLNGAREALSQYRKLAPEDANALDSEGEVSYMLGDFKSADEYFQRAAEKNPSEFVKAAEARLTMGDVKGADALFAKRFGAGARGHNGGADYQMAQWEYLSGKRNEGMARMEKLAQKGSGDLQALALDQLSIWKLDSGESKAAVELANEAAMRAQSPQARGVSALCQQIASGSTGSGSKMTDAAALLFANKLREAIPLLQAVYRDTSPAADGQVRTLLAWTYVQTGAIDQAAPLLDIYPLPLSSGDPLIASVILERYRYARGKVQAKVQPIVQPIVQRRHDPASTTK
jgi:tetratricopeptide (TPR) repeat protein